MRIWVWNRDRFGKLLQGFRFNLRIEMSENLKEVAVAVTYNSELDQFLLLKRSKDRERFPNKWEFASGFAEEDEDPRNAAIRELEEETGLIGEIIRTGEVFEVETERYHFLVQPVLASVDSNRVQMTGEHSEYRWCGIEEIEALDTVPNLERDLEKVGIK